MTWGTHIHAWPRSWRNKHQRNNSQSGINLNITTNCEINTPTTILIPIAIIKDQIQLTIRKNDRKEKDKEGTQLTQYDMMHSQSRLTGKTHKEEKGTHNPRNGNMKTTTILISITIIKDQIQLIIRKKDKKEKDKEGTQLTQWWHDALTITPDPDHEGSNTNETTHNPGSIWRSQPTVK